MYVNDSDFGDFGFSFKKLGRWVGKRLPFRKSARSIASMRGAAVGLRVRSMAQARQVATAVRTPAVPAPMLPPGVSTQRPPNPFVETASPVAAQQQIAAQAADVVERTGDEVDALQAPAGGPSKPAGLAVPAAGAVGFLVAGPIGGVIGAGVGFLLGRKKSS